MTHDATELFECAAEAFRAATGYPAIGKAAGPEYGGEAWQKERERLWMVFRAGYQRSRLDGRDALSAAQRENEKWKEMASHLAWCATCANEGLGFCEVGREIDAALSGQGGA